MGKGASSRRPKLDAATVEKIDWNSHRTLLRQGVSESELGSLPPMPQHLRAEIEAHRRKTLKAATSSPRKNVGPRKP